MIEFHTAHTSNGQRVAIALEECALPYRVYRYALVKGEHRTGAFEALNPAGMIPVIVDPDGPGGASLTLTQSGAILHYLAEKTGRFVPQDALVRARMHEWTMFALTDVATASAGIFVHSALVPEKSPANVGWYEERLLRFLRVADARLARHEWLAGELTIADFALYPVVALRSGLVDAAGEFPNLVRWRDALGARPAVVRGMSVADE